MASMSGTVSPFLVLLLVATATTSAAAFNITRILEQNPDFSSFNNFLNQTKVADAINSRRTITVLAVDNGAAGALSGRTDDVLKAILSLHVVLDYFDVDKFHKNRTTELTTLYQASGLATNNMGFLNATVQKNGDVLLGSMEPGSTLNSKVIKSVSAEPYNISVLQVSSLIIPQGIENTNKSGASPPPPPPPSPPAATPKKAPAPASGKAPAPASGKAPAPASRKAPAPASGKTPAKAPSTDDSAPAPSDDGAPTPSSGSSPAASPEADAPTSGSPPADAPAADAPGKDADAPSESAPADQSSAGHLVSFGGAAIGAMTILIALA